MIIKRKTIIKVIAILVIILGFLQLIDSFWSLFTRSHEVNLANFIIGFILLGAGDDLINLKLSGRRILLIISSIYALLLVVMMTLFFIAGDNSDPHLKIELFGKVFYQSENRTLIGIVVSIWTIATISVVIFLLQKKTKLLFYSHSSNEN